MSARKLISRDDIDRLNRLLSERKEKFMEKYIPDDFEMTSNSSYPNDDYDYEVTVSLSEEDKEEVFERLAEELTPFDYGAVGKPFTDKFGCEDVIEIANDAYENACSYADKNKTRILEDMFRERAEGLADMEHEYSETTMREMAYGDTERY